MNNILSEKEYQHFIMDRLSQDNGYIVRKATNSMKAEEAVEKILDMFARTRTNREFVEMTKKTRFI